MQKSHAILTAAKTEEERVIWQAEELMLQLLLCESAVTVTSSTGIITSEVLNLVIMAKLHRERTHLERHGIILIRTINK